MSQVKKIPTIRLPKGFIFKCNPFDYREGIPNTVSISLYRKLKSTRKIGHVLLYYEGDSTYETHSNLNRGYRGKGLGAKMYAKAIAWCLERGYKIRSSGVSSSDAQRVWRGKTLKKYFKIRVKKDKYNTSPDYFTWFAYLKKSKNAKGTRRSSKKRI